MKDIQLLLNFRHHWNTTNRFACSMWKFQGMNPQLGSGELWIQINHELHHALVIYTVLLYTWVIDQAYRQENNQSSPLELTIYNQMS